jgi:hypothetical protein
MERRMAKGSIITNQAENTKGNGSTIKNMGTALLITPMEIGIKELGEMENEHSMESINIRTETFMMDSGKTT